MNVLIADDHPVVRKGMRGILDEMDLVDVVVEVETHRQILDQVRRQDFALVVMDLDMPDGDALNTLAQLAAYAPDLPVLVVSVHPEDSYALRVLKAGASGYLQKAAAIDDLSAAVRRIHNGGKYVSPQLAERMLGVMQGEDLAPHSALSDREMQVLLALAEGASVSEIGADLNLSPKTISTYRARLFEKLELDSVADVVRYALEHDLID